ncbi:MAG: Gfo/Idh/MocA family oxidoreductase [Nocardioidaceae bacterium]
MTSLPDRFPPLETPVGPVRARPLPPGRPVRWGVVATGKIAHAFVGDLALLPDCEVVAVASRRQETADAFAAEHAVAAAYADYRWLVEDPAVDVVYVASPHALHREHVERALEAGKAVLCEKPLTLTAADARHLAGLARERGLFLMEAMWMRCHPLVRRLRQLVGTGALGEVRQVRADLGFVVDRPATDRLLDPALGGGALLDMGIYPLTFASLFLGEPAHVAATAALSPAGVDLDVAMALRYDSGALASLTASMTSWSPRTASVATDLGRLDLPAPFHHPEHARWTAADGDPDLGLPTTSQRLTEPTGGRGYTHEAAEVVRCLRRGETESPLVPLADTVALLRQMDAVREQIGVRYAADG